MYVEAIAALGILLAACYVVAPLFRPEADLQPFDRPRPGVQLCYGTDEPETIGPAGRCPRCERVVPIEFAFCDRCVERLGT